MTMSLAEHARLEEEMFLEQLPDLSAIEDPEEAAKTLYKNLCEWADSVGHKSEIEVAIFAPGERETVDNAWWVMYEAGPHDWAIHYTLDAKRRTYGPGWHCEPYWGFDVAFYEH